MSIQDLASLAGIASILICGANFVVMLIARTFWRLTFDEKKTNDEKRFAKMEVDINYLKEVESKNMYFRHNFTSVTKGLEEHITNEIKHLEDIINLKFQMRDK